MRIAFYGGSFNPPTRSHRLAVQFLAALKDKNGEKFFDKIIVMLCGSRPDKGSVRTIDPLHRAALCDLEFGDLGVEIDLSDLEKEEYTPNHEIQKTLEARFPGAEIWHIVGADIINKDQIRNLWKNGQRLWHTAKFGIFKRGGYVITEENLPPNHKILSADIPACSSTDIREGRRDGKDVSHLVSDRVNSYVERHGLYQTKSFGVTTEFRLGPDVRFMITWDKRNQRAVEIAETLRIGGLRIERKNPEAIIVIGGDGFMLRTIRKEWRKRIPILGVNAGHRGFLLHEWTAETLLVAIRAKEVLDSFLLRQLFVEAELKNGKTVTSLAFNDVWAERATGMTAWFRFKINGSSIKKTMPNVWCDQILIYTPQGSTAYAESLAGPPILLDSPALGFVVSAVAKPKNWPGKGLIPSDATISIATLDLGKRPTRLRVDGVSLGIANSTTIRQSRITAAELLFPKSRSLAAKIALSSFPK